MAMTSMQKRQQAHKLRTQAQELYDTWKDVDTGMPDEEARTYDGLMDQFDVLTRAADQYDAQEHRLNQAAAAKTYGERRGLSSGSYASGDGLAHNDLRNTRNGVHGFSVVKAIRQRLDETEGKGRLDGLELEVHQELSDRRFRDTKKRPEGVMIPFDLAIGGPSEGRALDTTAGVGAIPTIISTDMISLLRANMVTVGMGATVLANMEGLFAIPRQSAAATGYWIAEGGAPTASNQTIDQVPFSPKTVGAYTDYTRRFLEQTSIDAENFVRKDLMEVLARSLELAGLNGSGSSNQPTGIGQNSGVPTVSLGTNGALPTWATVVGMETKAAVANALIGRLGYVLNAATRGILKTTPKVGSTFPTFLWDTGSPAAPLNGYPVGITNLLPSNLTKGSASGICSMGLFGNWNDLIYCLWSGIDLLTDPYTGSTSGSVRVVALQDADINLRHPESFVKCVDILTA